ncbi:MAG TPA: class I SAM-dependent methyltransferase [Pyrinomonadaceae bacterium]|nr:class I SAM-dependent methyltransferase [Pyrinomonadaceae bacterium]
MKSPKELAFLEDLYIATDWGERFAELVDDHVELPKEGRAVYLAAGTGAHALALQARAGHKLELLCVDENEECLELAKAKAVAVNQEAEFRREQLRALSFHDDEFDLVLGNGSMVAPPQLPEMLAEMGRVVRPGANVAWLLPTAPSFGEFFSIYWEALLGAGLDEHGAEVEQLIVERPTVRDAEKWAKQAGLEAVTSWTNIEEFDFESGEQFFNSPLIADFLLPTWTQSVPKASRKKVMKELARIIDAERHSGEFSLTLKATLLVGRKGHVQ